LINKYYFSKSLSSLLSVKMDGRPLDIPILNVS
jgi:hypothetical protein